MLGRRGPQTGPCYGAAMQMTPDELLSELRTIASRLDQLPPGHTDRTALETRRAELRELARTAAEAQRDPRVLRAELEHLEARLTELEEQKITVPSWQTELASHRLTITDPSAQANRVNAEIERGTAAERGAIEERIAQIREALGE